MKFENASSTDEMRAKMLKYGGKTTMNIICVSGDMEGRNTKE